MLTIQASNPRVEGSVEATDQGLNDLMQSVFPLHAEDAVIRWHAAPIVLSYKYDLSICAEYWLSFVASLLANETSGVVSFPSDTFQCRWSFQCSRDDVDVTPKWDCVQ